MTVKKILILRFGAIGDVVHTTALFRSLKKYDSEIKIHYATFKIPAVLIQNDPDLKKVWIVEGKTYKHLVNLAKELRKEKFDVFINLQPSIKTNIFSLILGAKKTVAYKKTFKLHAVENFWKTAKPVFKDIILDKEIKIYLPEEASKKIQSLIKTDNKLIGFNMGVSSVRQGRKWPLEYWSELAASLVAKYNCQIVLTGSDEDAEEANILENLSPNITSFCGKLSLIESAALMQRCNIFISGDTGPLHIATAIGTFTIGLYGAAPISRTGPYGNQSFALKSDLKCIPCNRRKCKFQETGNQYNPCMLNIKPEMILNLMEKHYLSK
ncbi:MAG: glycosyltransferase family 9 protein [bacterium]